MLPLFLTVLAIDPALLTPEKLPARPELPDALVTFDGTRVATKADWETKRKPEIASLVQTLMYGRVPAVKPQVTGRVTYTDPKALNGTATLDEIELTVAPGAPPVSMLLVTPTGKAKPAGVFVTLNFTGNHTLLVDPKIGLPKGWVAARNPGVVANRATDKGRGTATTFPLADIVAKGYAVATVYYGDILPDDAKVRGGLADLIQPQVKGETPGDATGAVMGWAWGMSRMADYLVTRPELDAKRMIVLGHSRLGKAALLAGAMDERFAAVIPHQAGCGGSAPSRRHNPKGEPLQRINTTFPHWFCPNFKQFNTAAEKLPFDQHCVVGLCAPRPVLFSNASADQWADPPGQFDVLKAASPVYALYGVPGVSGDAPPAENVLTEGRLAYWIRPGNHAMTAADWVTFIAFADRLTK